MTLISRCKIVGARVSHHQLLVSIFFLLIVSAPLSATSLYCQISVDAPGTRAFQVSCRATNLPATEKIELRFLDRFAGIENLSERVTSLRIKDAKDLRLLPEIHGNGVYRAKLTADAEIAFEYTIKTDRLNGAGLDPSRYSLVSSLGTNAGTILLADVLPELCAVDEKTCAPPAVRVKFNLPEEWQVATVASASYGAYELTDPRRAVFLLGKLRQQIINVGETKLQVALAGEWNLSDMQVALSTASIVQEQIKLMHKAAADQYLVTLMPFPVPLEGLRSAAMTRGTSVVMMLNPEADAPATLKLYQRLLAHELFHFYLPEAFTVRENFDWFWEGFARYIGLLTLNRLQLLSRRELWDEMQRESDAYRANAVHKTISLIAASPEKFARAAHYDLVYRKGTIVAWLFDMEARRQSDGRTNVIDVMRDLHKNYGHEPFAIGNREVLAALRKAGSFDSFIADYIEGTREIDWEKILKPHGLLGDTKTGRTRILLSSSLTSKQKLVLAQFGQ